MVEQSIEQSSVKLKKIFEFEYRRYNNSTNILENALK